MPAVQDFTTGQKMPVVQSLLPKVKDAGRQQFSYEQYGDGRELFRDDRPNSRNSIQISSYELLSSVLSESTKMLTAKMATNTR